MASNDKIKILIVDDHDIVRKGLAMLVSRQEDFSVVAEAVVDPVQRAFLRGRLDCHHTAIRGPRNPNLR